MLAKWLVFAIALLTLFVAGCSTSRGGDLIVVGQTGAPVEREILRRQEYVDSVNASVGAEPSHYMTDRPDLNARFRRLIERRYLADLRSVYGEDYTTADACYLLIARRRDGYLLHVIRIRHIASDGGYADVEGLTYLLDETGREIIDVRPSHY